MRTFSFVYTKHMNCIDYESEWDISCRVNIIIDLIPEMLIIIGLIY